MSGSRSVSFRLGSAAMLAWFAACSPPGLPPAGPAPGDVDVGYGTRPAGSTTGAVSTVTEDETDQVGELRIDELLRGKIPGLQVIRTQNGVSYRLRGQNSLLYDAEPLFVVDGIPTSVGHLPGALAGLVSEDIRQIDVLKDVASTSIYGMRGAGGVIIITTRR